MCSVTTRSWVGVTCSLCPQLRASHRIWHTVGTKMNESTWIPYGRHVTSHPHSTNPSQAYSVASYWPFHFPPSNPSPVSTVLKGQFWWDVPVVKPSRAPTAKVLYKLPTPFAVYPQTTFHILPFNVSQTFKFLDPCSWCFLIILFWAPEDCLYCDEYHTRLHSLLLLSSPPNPHHPAPWVPSMQEPCYIQPYVLAAWMHAYDRRPHGFWV